MKTDHIVIQTIPQRILCERCGEWVPMNLPAILDELHARAEEFIKRHQNCKKQELKEDKSMARKLTLTLTISDNHEDGCYSLRLDAAPHIHGSKKLVLDQKLPDESLRLLLETNERFRMNAWAKLGRRLFNLLDGKTLPETKEET